MRWITLLLLAAVLGSSCGAKILALVPMPARSHSLLFERLVVELAKRGHQVTYVSAFPFKHPIANLTQVNIPQGQELLQSQLKMDLFEFRHMSPFSNTVFLPLMGIGLCDAVLDLPGVKALKKEKFDLIFGEAFLEESIMAGFSHLSNAPMVALATFMPNIWVNFLVGNVAPASYIPDPFIGYTPRMTFTERLLNTLIGVVGEASHVLYYLPKQDAIMRKHFGNDLPPLIDIVKNTSLALVNHQHSLGFPRPYVPNMIEIGGIHIEPPKKLPQDLQKYLDESRDGVILFSLGSNLQSSLMPAEKIKLFLNAFSKLKQNVLWKFEADSLPGQPKNVKISKWLPQSDLLAHPNLKLFITHGGLLSTTEAVYRGVPVVGIPIFGDQPLNMKQTENAGFGLTLNFDTVTEEALISTINEVLNNPKYREVVKLKSKLIKDAPLTPLETAVYWIEYVIRHKGAPHLRSAAQDLAWYQRYLVDVIAVLAVGAAAVAIISCYITRCLISLVCCRGSKKTEKITKHKKKN